MKGGEPGMRSYMRRTTISSLAGPSLSIIDSLLFKLTLVSYPNRANLNASYFSNRQDRYLHFASESSLADYCFEFLKTVSTFSYKILASDSQSTAPSTPIWTHSSVHPHNFEAKAETAFKTFQAAHTNPRRLSPSSSEDETLILPVIQGGQFNIREEERGMSTLFKHLSQVLATSSDPKPVVNLTSGYFGLYEPYQDLILKSGISTKILCASPLVGLPLYGSYQALTSTQANGFYGSSGISGRIPEGYTYLEQMFMNSVRRAGKEGSSESGLASGVDLSEWHKPDWTYHAKGGLPSQDALYNCSMSLRNLGITISCICPILVALRFDKPQLTFRTPRYRAILLHADVCRKLTEPAASRAGCNW